MCTQLGKWHRASFHLLFLLCMNCKGNARGPLDQAQVDFHSALKIWGTSGGQTISHGKAFVRYKVMRNPPCSTGSAVSAKGRPVASASAGSLVISPTRQREKRLINV